MECPHCESIDNKVIDSRLTRERFSIRRRRECLTCSERFTTYESTEERLLPVLIRKKAGMGATKTKLKTMLSFLSDTLKTLSGETENLIDKVDKLEQDLSRYRGMYGGILLVLGALVAAFKLFGGAVTGWFGA